MQSSERPSMDLFKAIFENSEASSSSSSDASDGEEKHESDTELKAADDGTGPDSVSNTAAAAVVDAALLTQQHFAQQPSDDGMMICQL